MTSQGLESQGKAKNNSRATTKVLSNTIARAGQTQNRSDDLKSQLEDMMCDGTKEHRHIPRGIFSAEKEELSTMESRFIQN
ncbi:hypothetical protein ATANTOWER_020363 [Ataeniobius toweri]|uniref:Uncharacterized protein n=1 Tax=Ataeniobius toweri TaxID=208326 RepID=A0ABU7C8S8_9TELE|nr:hypothetical protein [Ataeniobius toweri]